MESATVRFKFPMASTQSRAQRRKAASAGDSRSSSSPSSSPATKPVSKVARMLALAYCIERAIESGGIRGNSDAARALGLSRARLTQVMGLLLLSPEIQARILAGELATTEHGLRRVAAEAVWITQSEVLEFTGTAQTKPSGDAAKKKKAL